MKKIGIITAMKDEADHIIESHGLKLSHSLQNISIYENDKIVLALAGIGKVQSSIATTYLFMNYDIEKLINIGIAGSLAGEKARIGDVFIVNQIIQHDMYLPFEGSHLDYAKKEIIIDGEINADFSHLDFGVYINAIGVTGDQFIDNREKLNELVEKYRAQVVEMEAFAVASVAREFDSLNKCIFIKAISDGADNEAKDAHMGNLDFAMQNSLKILEKFIN